jgi:hypothetical protein
MAMGPVYRRHDAVLQFDSHGQQFRRNTGNGPRSSLYRGRRQVHGWRRGCSAPRAMEEWSRSASSLWMCATERIFPAEACDENASLAAAREALERPCAGLRGRIVRTLRQCGSREHCQAQRQSASVRIQTRTGSKVHRIGYSAAACTGRFNTLSIGPKSATRPFSSRIPRLQCRSSVFGSCEAMTRMPALPVISSKRFCALF